VIQCPFIGPLQETEGNRELTEGLSKNSLDRSRRMLIEGGRAGQWKTPDFPTSCPQRKLRALGELNPWVPSLANREVTGNSGIAGRARMAHDVRRDHQLRSG